MIMHFTRENELSLDDDDETRWWLFILYDDNNEIKTFTITTMQGQIMMMKSTDICVKKNDWTEQRFFLKVGLFIIMMILLVL